MLFAKQATALCAGRPTERLNREKPANQDSLGRQKSRLRRPESNPTEAQEALAEPLTPGETAKRDALSPPHPPSGTFSPKGEKE